MVKNGQGKTPRNPDDEVRIKRFYEKTGETA